MGASSLAQNLRAASYLAALADTVGLAVDVAATLVPYVPGGVGAALKGRRAVKAAEEAAEKLASKEGREALQELGQRLVKRKAEQATEKAVERAAKKEARGTAESTLRIPAMVTSQSGLMVTSNRSAATPVGFL